MSDNVNNESQEEVAIDVSRRSACAVLGLFGLSLGQMAFSKEQGTELALADRYGLMRRAYQTGDAELLRQFYSKDVVLATEGSSPIVGLDAAVLAGHAVLAKRRDITTDVLRTIHSPAGDAASHFVKLCAYPRDPAESPRIATALILWQRESEGWRCNAEVILIQDMDAVVGFRISTNQR
jgi:ketosteroid isomerase-like protein